ncbi:hypothetical protein HK098_001946 [Nowakowskiella sp. JEL0407]|nr:hypothetical protein HK098_001946 [Nowakowskiella sp. JEL0407]
MVFYRMIPSPTTASKLVETPGQENFDSGGRRLKYTKALLEAQASKSSLPTSSSPQTPVIKQQSFIIAQQQAAETLSKSVSETPANNYETTAPSSTIKKPPKFGVPAFPIVASPMRQNTNTDITDDLKKNSEMNSQVNTQYASIPEETSQKPNTQPSRPLSNVVASSPKSTSFLPTQDLKPETKKRLSDPKPQQKPVEIANKPIPTSNATTNSHSEPEKKQTCEIPATPKKPVRVPSKSSNSERTEPTTQISTTTNYHYPKLPKQAVSTSELSTRDAQDQPSQQIPTENIPPKPSMNSTNNFNKPTDLPPSNSPLPIKSRQSQPALFSTATEKTEKNKQQNETAPKQPAEPAPIKLRASSQSTLSVLENSRLQQEPKNDPELSEAVSKPVFEQKLQLSVSVDSETKGRSTTGTSKSITEQRPLPSSQSSAADPEIKNRSAFAISKPAPEPRPQQTTQQPSSNSENREKDIGKSQSDRGTAPANQLTTMFISKFCGKSPNFHEKHSKITPILYYSNLNTIVECGTKYFDLQQKFCGECGMKRI